MHFVYVEEAVNVLLLFHLLENTRPLCPSRCPYLLCGCLGVFDNFCADSCSNKPAVLFYYEAMVSKCLKLSSVYCATVCFSEFPECIFRKARAQRLLYQCEGVVWHCRWRQRNVHQIISCIGITEKCGVRVHPLCEALKHTSPGHWTFSNHCISREALQKVGLLRASNFDSSVYIRVAWM